MLDKLKVTIRRGQRGAGIYEAGEKCYTKLFITDSQRVLPVNHRALSEDDLLTVYSWGYEDALAAHGLEPPEYDDEQWPYDEPPAAMEGVLGRPASGETGAKNSSEKGAAHTGASSTAQSGEVGR